jgi:hypothetical protein
MQDSTIHKLSCFKTISTSPKREKTGFELKNIQTVQNISEFLNTLKEKNAKHNSKVAKNARDVKILKFQQREKRKSEFLSKEERVKWREIHGFDIKNGKNKWTALMVAFTAALVAVKKVRVRKVRDK